MYRVSREGRRAGAIHDEDELPKGYKRLAGAVNPYHYKSSANYDYASHAMKKLDTADPVLKLVLKIAAVLFGLLIVRSVRMRQQE